MTNEKMAEEYADKTFGMYYPTDQERVQVEQAFLSGLEAGRPKWHKDKFLPRGKVEGYYRVILYDNYREPQIVGPETEIEFIGNQREHIIAWCEIPRYTEE